MMVVVMGWMVMRMMRQVWRRRRRGHVMSAERSERGRHRHIVVTAAVVANAAIAVIVAAVPAVVQGPGHLVHIGSTRRLGTD